MTWCSASFTRLVRSRVPCVDHQYISLVAVAQWIALALLKCVPPMRALLLPQQVQKWPALMLPQESLSSKISTDIPFRGPTPFPLTMFHGPDIKWVWVWDWDSFTNQNFGCFWYHLVSSKRKRTANFETKLLMGLSHAMPRLQWTRPVKRHTSHHPNAWRSARLGKAVVTQEWPTTSMTCTMPILFLILHLCSRWWVSLGSTNIKQQKVKSQLCYGQTKYDKVIICILKSKCLIQPTTSDHLQAQWEHRNASWALPQTSEHGGGLDVQLPLTTDCDSLQYLWH